MLMALVVLIAFCCKSAFGSLSFPKRSSSASPSYFSSGSSGSGYYSDDYYYSKRQQQLLRDNDVEDIAPDSMLQLIAYMSRKFLLPPFEMAWNNAITPVLDMMWECGVFLKAYALDNIFDVVCAIYAHVQPLLLMIQENLQALSDLLASRMYEYIVCPVFDFLHIIWENLVWTTHSLWSILYDAAVVVGNKSFEALAWIGEHIMNIFDALYPLFAAVEDNCYSLAHMLYENVISPIFQLLHIMMSYMSLWCNDICECMSFVGNQIKQGVIYFLVDILSPIYKHCVAAISRFFIGLYDFVSDPICQFFASFADVFNQFIDMLYEYIFSPLGRLVENVWTEYIYPTFAQIFGKLFGFVWNVLRSIYFGIRDSLSSFRRFVLEWNVAKFAIPTTNENLALIEVGVYNARISNMNNRSYGWAYVQQKDVAEDGYDYLWLRNNDETRNANAEIRIYGQNGSKLGGKKVRLNVRKSHAIPLEKQVLLNTESEEACKKIRIEFMLEHVAQTKQDQSNQAVRASNDDEDQEAGNVAVTGDGALYIAVDENTRCQYEFLLCYEK